MSRFTYLNAKLWLLLSWDVIIYHLQFIYFNSCSYPFTVSFISLTTDLTSLVASTAVIFITFIMKARTKVELLDIPIKQWTKTRPELGRLCLRMAEYSKETGFSLFENIHQWSCNKIIITFVLQSCLYVLAWSIKIFSNVCLWNIEHFQSKVTYFVRLVVVLHYVHMT